MFGKIVSKFVIVGAICGAALLVTAAPSFAIPSGCTTAVSLPGNFLYKPANFHGGRGPSFLLGCQQHRNWPSKSTLNIFGEDGSVVGRFRLYDSGHHPYGRRYYTGLAGGFPGTSGVLAKNAKKHGGKKIYILGKGGTCFIINNPNSRQGSLNTVSGNGSC